MSYFITYDLCKPGQNYDGLIEAIKTYNCAHIAESVWVVTSSKTAAQIRDHLRRYIDNNDVLFVGVLTGEAAWYGEPKSISDWLHKYLDK